jgi:uncharacterized damage-inducible protein DinB
MNEVERIKIQLQRTFAGEAWHGPSLLESLAGVSAEKALAKPAGSTHSIWEIVLHIETWEEAIRCRIIGDARKVSDEEDWRKIDETDEAAWHKTLASTEETHRSLIEAVSRLNDADLLRTVDSQEGIEHTLYVSLHGGIHHLLYHTGQIALLKKLA